MEYATTGYPKNQQNDGIAELACGPAQYVRHKPPWQLRPWVTAKKRRDEHIGYKLNCKKCDRGEPKDFSIIYR